MRASFFVFLFTWRSVFGGRHLSVGSGGIETRGAHLRSPCRFTGASTTRHIQLDSAFGLRLLLFEPDSPATARSAAFHHGHDCIAKTAYLSRAPRQSVHVLRIFHRFLQFLLRFPQCNLRFRIGFFLFRRRLSMHRTSILEGVERTFEVSGRGPARVLAKGMIRRLRFYLFFSLPVAWTR